MKKGENQTWILILSAFNSWSREYFGEEKSYLFSLLSKNGSKYLPQNSLEPQIWDEVCSREAVGISWRTAFGTTWQRMVDNLSSVQFQGNDNNWSQKHWPVETTDDLGPRSQPDSNNVEMSFAKVHKGIIFFPFLEAAQYSYFFCSHQSV